MDKLEKYDLQSRMKHMSRDTFFELICTNARNLERFSTMRAGELSEEHIRETLEKLTVYKELLREEFNRRLEGKS